MTAAPVMSITDELIAELEGLANVNHAYVPVHQPVMRALLAERAELKKDAERYRWLREDARQDVDGYLNQTPVIVHAVNYVDDWRNRLDAAIDAAMQAAQ